MRTTSVGNVFIDFEGFCADFNGDRVVFGHTYIKIGTIQRRLAWPLRKDDTQIREAFQIFHLQRHPERYIHNNSQSQFFSV